MATDTRNPTSDEAASGTWTGSAGTRYQSVDDHPDSSGADFLTHGTTAGNITFGFSAFAIPAGSTSISVAVDYYDRKTASQAAQAAGRLKIGASYYNASTHNPSTTRTLRTDTWSTNPATTAAWTVSEVNSIAAFGMYSGDASPTIELSSIQLSVTYTPPVTGDLAATGSADTASTDGTVAWITTLASTESADTASENGTVAWIATLASTETEDGFTGAGEVSSSGVAGDLAATESEDVFSFGGLVEWAVSLAVNEAAESSAVDTTAEWIVAFAAGEAADTSAMSGEAEGSTPDGPIGLGGHLLHPGVLLSR